MVITSQVSFNSIFNNALGCPAVETRKKAYYESSLVNLGTRQDRPATYPVAG